MKTSKAIAQSLAERGVTPTEQTIRVVVFDGDQALCLNEQALDTWWANLTPDHKAELYEADLEGEIRDEAPDAVGFTPPTAIEVVDRIEQQLNRSITVCRDSLPFFQQHPDLAIELIQAAEALLPKARTVDAHV